MSSTDSESEESLLRVGAISPKVRTEYNTNFNKYMVSASDQNELLIKSTVQYEPEDHHSLRTGTQTNNLTGFRSESNATPAYKNLVDTSDDSEDSDEELSVIERDIQMSLENVTNKLRGYSTTGTATATCT